MAPFLLVELVVFVLFHLLLLRFLPLGKLLERVQWAQYFAPLLCPSILLASIPLGEGTLH